MSTYSEEQLAELRREYEERGFELWLAEKEAAAGKKLTDAEKEQAAKMGLNALAYVQSKPAPRLAGEELAEAQRAQAAKMGVELPDDFDVPAAWWDSRTFEAAAMEKAERIGPEAVVALVEAIVENQRLISQGRSPSVKVPAECLVEGVAW